MALGAGSPFVFLNAFLTLSAVFLRGTGNEGPVFCTLSRPPE